MSDLSLDARCTIPDDVVFRELDGEAVVLNLDTGIYFGLDTVGTRLWELLVELGSLRAVHARMLAEFDVTPDVLEQDLIGFVGQIHERGLVAIEG